MDNFAEIHLPVNLRLPVCISLNSTLFQLMVNVNGRSNLGGGALAVQIYELENLLCVNPELILNGEQINQGILESEDWDVLKPSPARRSIDNIIFDILGLTQGERDGVYGGSHTTCNNPLRESKECLTQMEKWLKHWHIFYRKCYTLERQIC